MDLINCSFDKVKAVYAKYFSLGCLNAGLDKKLALVAMVCYVTHKLNEKKDPLHQVTCYQVICKIGQKFPYEIKETFFKALAAVCEDFMYGSTEFPTFGVEPKQMPTEIQKILETWLPF